MMIGCCKWCGRDIEGTRNLLGCKMICEQCKEEDEAEEVRKAELAVDKMVSADIAHQKHGV